MQIVSLQSLPREEVPSNELCPVCFHTKHEDDGQAWVAHYAVLHPEENQRTRLIHAVHKGCLQQSFQFSELCPYRDVNLERPPQEGLGHVLLKNARYLGIITGTTGIVGTTALIAALSIASGIAATVGMEVKKAVLGAAIAAGSAGFAVLGGMIVPQEIVESRLKGTAFLAMTGGACVALVKRLDDRTRLEVNTGVGAALLVVIGIAKKAPIIIMGVDKVHNYATSFIKTLANYLIRNAD